MRLILAVAISILISPASAQQPAKEFTFTFTEADINEIWQALQERPFKAAAPVIGKIKMQYDTQLKPPTTPDPPK